MQAQDRAWSIVQVSIGLMGGHNHFGHTLVSFSLRSVVDQISYTNWGTTPVKVVDSGGNH